MMILETSLLRRLPPVSAKLSLLAAGTGLLLVTMGLFAGALLLVPAGLSFLLGLGECVHRAVQVVHGRAYIREGNTTLIAATFINGSATLFTAMAAFILLYFGA